MKSLLPILKRPSATRLRLLVLAMLDAECNSSRDPYAQLYVMLHIVRDARLMNMLTRIERMLAMMLVYGLDKDAPDIRGIQYVAEVVYDA